MSVSTPVASVVIPTHERLGVLREVIDALEAQEGAPPFEVVVVDDGSRDDTWRWLVERQDGRFLRAFRQDNAGPAVARNRGVEEARGEWVAFLGDDTVPSTGWLAAHHRARQQHAGPQPLGTLGYTRWHSRMRSTPFLRYINEYGLQFGYALIEDPGAVPFNFLYTSNLTLPRTLLLEEPFDTAFPYAAWEDIELSYRLHRRGLRLRYHPEAVVAHDHPTDLGRFTRRQYRAGYCAVVFHRRHPELGPFLGLGPEGPPPLPPRWRQRLRELVARALQYVSPGDPPWAAPLWEEVLRYHYIEGLQRGWQEVGR